MWYKRLGRGEKARRTAERLVSLKAQFELEVPKKSEENLLLATWNIREFDSPAYGRRDIEPLYYISEIISHFDLVAVQEVREDLKALKTVKNFLGEWWKFIATDVSEGKPGNRERLAYLYDTRKVKFGNIAGEVVIKPIEKKVAGGRKISRSPECIPKDWIARIPRIGNIHHDHAFVGGSDECIGAADLNVRQFYRQYACVGRSSRVGGIGNVDNR